METIPEKFQDFKSFEKEIFDIMCGIACELMREHLEMLDLSIMGLRDIDEYRHKGIRESTIKTLMGEVTYSRRYYKTTNGKYIFLLDELMEIDSGCGLYSENLIEQTVIECTEKSYRQAAASISSLTGQSISAMGAWDVLQKFGEKLTQQENRLKELDAGGSTGHLGNITSGVIMQELDDVWLSMQNEKRQKRAKKSTDEAENRVNKPIDETGNCVKPTDEAENRVSKPIDEAENLVKPIDEAGNRVKPTDEAGNRVKPTDEAGNRVKPTDEAENRVNKPIDETGDRVKPTDEAENRANKPIDEAGNRVNKPIDETGNRVKPTDEAGNLVKPTVEAEVREPPENTEKKPKKAGMKPIHIGIAYTGWTQSKDGRYNTVNKIAYASFDKTTEFVSDFEMLMRHRYDMDGVERRITNGDGDPWIRAAAEMSDSIFQLDPYHRSQAIIKAISEKSDRNDVYAAIKEKDVDNVLDIISDLHKTTQDEEEQKKIGQLYSYFNSNKDSLLTWKERGIELPEPPAGVTYRNLGVQESSNCTLITLRMKHRRCSWSINGANHMAGILCYRHTIGLDTMLGVLPEAPPAKEIVQPLSAAKAPSHDGKGYGADWLRAEMPFEHTFKTNGREAIRGILRRKPLTDITF